MSSEDEKEYLTLDEVAKETGIKKGSLYYYLKELEIEQQKFPLKKNAYISRDEVEMIKEAKSSPWKISELKARRSRQEDSGNTNGDTPKAA
jgi:hypothetical protein